MLLFNLIQIFQTSKCILYVQGTNDGITGRDDGTGETSTEEALAEFDFLGAGDTSDHRPQGDNSDWGNKRLKFLI